MSRYAAAYEEDFATLGASVEDTSSEPQPDPRDRDPKPRVRRCHCGNLLTCWPCADWDPIATAAADRGAR